MASSVLFTAIFLLLSAPWLMVGQTYQLLLTVLLIVMWWHLYFLLSAVIVFHWYWAPILAPGLRDQYGNENIIMYTLYFLS